MRWDGIFDILTDNK